MLVNVLENADVRVLLFKEVGGSGAVEIGCF